MDIPLLTPTTGSGQLREFGVVVVYGGEYYFLTNQPHFDMLWIFVGSGWVVGQFSGDDWSMDIVGSENRLSEWILLFRV